MPKSKRDKQQLVLDELRRHGNRSRAARVADIDRKTIDNWRKDDPVFKAASDAALEEGRL